MGNNLDAIVSVDISATAPQVTREGFGTPLILSDHDLYVDVIREYTSPAGLVGDGFSTSSPEYLAAQAIFSQQPSPPVMKLGRRANRVTQRVDVTVESAVVGATYSVVLNGVTYSYVAVTDDTPALIEAGLVAAIGSQAGLTITGASPGAGQFRVAASAAGTWFQMANATLGLLSFAQSHADPGIAADLVAIDTVDDDWYGFSLITEGAAEIAAAAAWSEANSKLFVQNSQDSQIVLHAAAGATDIAHTLSAAEYFRTGPLYCGDNGQFSAAAWMGAVLPLAAGSETWAFKTLAGVTPDVLTPTQVANLQAKFCNYYTAIAGVNITQTGVVSGNEWIDVIRGRDALVADIQENIFQEMVDAVKIPFTDGGVNIIVNEVQESLTAYVGIGFLSDNPKPIVTAPLVANVSGANKTARILPGVTFTGELAGAIQVAQINGSVTA